MTATTRTVTDQNGVRYELAELLGRGGQGAVYAVKGGRLAAKIITGGSPDRRERLRNQLMHVRRLPLGDLALARPLEMLRPPHTGYVMDLLTGMTPAKTLLAPPKGQSPSEDWYLGGGGLRRRFLLLGSAAHLLAQLHAKGLAYSDPSPANIFVSASPDDHEVWLIDADNLQYESVKAAGVFTPGFGAPELVAGTSGITTLSDAFAFAVLAYQTLTLAHPFIGDLVSDGDPDLEEQAFAGRFPWIDDPHDDRNRASFGVPRARVLSPRLVEAFAQAFGPGRADPASRPGASEWADRLFAAADATIRCRSCPATFFFTSAQCPWCGSPATTFVTTVFHLWDPEFGPQGGILTRPKGDVTRPVLVGHGAVSNEQTFVITRRLAFGLSAGAISEPVASVTLVGDRIKLKSLDGRSYRIFSPNGEQSSEIGARETTIRLEERQGSWRLHLGDNDSVHRVVTFELRKGVGA